MLQGRESCKLHHLLNNPLTRGRRTFPLSINRLALCDLPI